MPSLRLGFLHSTMIFGSDFGCIGVNDNVGSLRADFSAKLHTLLQIDLVCLIAVLMNQLVDP